MICKECKIEMWFDRDVDNGHKFVCKKCGKEAIQTKEELQKEYDEKYKKD